MFLIETHHLNYYYVAIMTHCIKVDEHYIFTPATLQATYGTQFNVLSSIYAVHK